VVNEIERLREVARAATPGPWLWCPWDLHPTQRRVTVAVFNEAEDLVADVRPEGERERDMADAEYIATFDPPTVLALLDRLEAAEGAVERVRAILTAWEAWDGSPGPDGRMHADSSSPRDRERLRRALDGPQDAQ
jgi:hypothetical protein